MNTLLREQLDQMKASNQRLAGDLEKATVDLQILRSEMEQKESQLHKGREVNPVNFITALQNHTLKIIRFIFQLPQSILWDKAREYGRRGI